MVLTEVDAQQARSGSSRRNRSGRGAPRVRPDAEGLFRGAGLDNWALRRYNKQDDRSRGAKDTKTRQRGDARFLAAALFWRGGWMYVVVGWETPKKI
jgi:hypothetical protein